MPVILEGQTRCRVCGERLIDAGDALTLPPVVGNEADPLWALGGGAFHKECIYKHPLGSAALALLKETREQLVPDKRFCWHCKLRIQDPSDYFSIGRLAGNPSNPLYSYNYLQLHRHCLVRWDGRAQLAGLLGAAKKSGEWRGAVLREMLQALENSERSVDNQ